jgi:hypothetical protein
MAEQGETPERGKVGGNKPTKAAVPDPAKAEVPDPAKAALKGKAKVRLSDMLSVIANDESRERISINDLLAAMDGRAMGALLLIFALPNVLPSLPGTSAILGLPLVYLTSQMMLGRLPWLPKFIANRSLPHSDFAALIDRMEPWLARSERVLRPRMSWLANERAERVIGAVTLLLSVILILPIPFGNMLPAFAIALFALGLLEKDGVLVIAGIVATIVTTSVVAGVLYALAKSVIFVLQGAF